MNETQDESTDQRHDSSMSMPQTTEGTTKTTDIE